MEKQKKILPRFRNRLEEKGLQYTLSLTFTFAAVWAVVLIAAGYSRQFSVTTQQLVKTNNQNIVDQINIHLDDYIHNLMQISNTAYYNIIKETDFTKDDTAIGEQLHFLYENNTAHILNIALFKKDGSLLTVQPQMTMKSGADPTKEEWFQEANSRIENVHFTAPYVENLFYPADNRYHWVVSLSRSVEWNEGGRVRQGVLLINMNFAGIEKITGNTGLGSSGYLYITDQEGNLIYHPHLQKIYAGLSSENNLQTALLEDGTHTERFQGEERLVTIKIAGYTGWKVVAVTPMKELSASFVDNRLLLWMLTAAVIAVLIGTNIFISAKVTTPLRKLERAVSRIEQDIRFVDIPVEGSFEVRHLSAALINMTNTMRRLMDDIVKQQETMRETEMMALQSQINPHFLYNTLDSTVWMIESGRYDGAVTMITALARFFRLSLSKGKNIIPLKDELEQVRNYLMIQEIRYKNKFTYSIELDEQIADAATIKLIVQPLVENAIYHAMDFMYEDGEIFIRAYAAGEEIYIDIEDNGPGMTEGQVEALITGKAAPAKKRGSGLGFQNVLERIKLFYGKNYGMEVVSEPDEGTRIRIHIPHRKMEG